MFFPIGTDSDNEIAAHMNMFSRQENPGHYWDMIHQVGKNIKQVVQKVRSK
jgi:hypothetical protein